MAAKLCDVAVRGHHLTTDNLCTFNVMEKAYYLYNVLLAFIFLGLFCCVLPDTNITFETTPKDYDIFEKTTIHLLCEQDIQSPLFINHKGVAIVKNSQLVGLSSKYSWSQQQSSNTFILTITQVDESDTGRYFCTEGIIIVKQVYIEVFYHPSEPECSSSYGSSVFFFDDILQQKFQFNCTIEDGKPPITFLLFKEKGIRETLDPDEITIIVNGQHLIKTVTFSSYLNNSFNNNLFVCNAVQTMPTALSGYDINKTCSYGPMKLLPSFDISVDPSNVTIREGEEAHVTCSSNVSDVEKIWRSIPEDLKYKIVEDENGLHLNIVYNKALEKQLLTVVCELSYGQRQLTADVIIYNEHGDNVPGRSKLWIIISAVVLGLAILLVVCGYTNRNKSTFRKKFNRVPSDNVS